MSFMTPKIHDPELFLLTEDGIEFLSETPLSFLPEGEWDIDATLSPEELATLVQFLNERNLDQVEVVNRYWGWLSADGYLDATDPVIGESRAEVAQQLIDLYYDRSPDEMTPDEREEREALEKIANPGKELPSSEGERPM